MGSIFDRKALADFIEPALERIEPGVKAAVVKVEKITDREESKNPVMAFDIKQDLIDRMTDRGDHTQHSIHRIPPAGENDPSNPEKPAEHCHATLSRSRVTV